MEANPYSPPQAELVVVNTSQSAYYVVSIRKFTLLFFLTLGLYGFYWFYQNWSAYRSYSGEKIWPVARTIFSIFFTHSLFSKIDIRLGERNIPYKWSPRTVATWYVVLSIVGNVLDRISAKDIGSPISDMLSILILPAMYYTLLIPQKAVNAVEGDPQGESNADLSMANFAWIGIGALMWIAVIASLAMILGLVPAEFIGGME